METGTAQSSTRPPFRFQPRALRLNQSYKGDTSDGTNSALKALLPALAAGVQKNTQQPGGIVALLGALSKGDHDQYLDRPERVAQPEAISDGNAILGHLIGSKDMSRSVASAASQKTGISDQLL